MSKNYAKIIMIYAIISGVVFVCLQFSLLDSWQEKIFDRFFTKKSPPNDIVIFAIDNESILQIGQWPWLRKIFANALQKLQSAKVVAVDVNFSEPSKTDPAGDSLFSATIKNALPIIILPVQINQKTKEVTRPLDIFNIQNHLGSVDIVSEDGMARNVENFKEGFTSFGALTALQYKENVIIPNLMRIDYAGPGNTFLTLPIADLLQNKIPETLYQGKVVLVGATAPDLHDFLQTPFGLLSGVEINANIAQTILSQKFYKNLPWHMLLVIMLVCNGAAVLLVIKIKRLYALIFSLVFFLSAINVAGMLLFSYNIIFPVLYISLGFIITSAVLVIFQYIAESEQKKIIYNSFKYYLSPEIIHELILDPKKLKLGGERKKITVFFSDIRGFSGISEVLLPETLTYVVSEYMTEMTDIIMAERGLVSQYFGDGIMAFWGAPLPNINQAQDACASALKMMVALEKLNKRFNDEHINAQIKIGVGINTGEVIAGNIGSKKKFNYTVFGDGVNLTARLEGLNKEYGTNIIISEATKKEIEHNPKFILRELDTIVVKGKKEPTKIFEILVKPLYKDIMGHFTKGQVYYKEGKWQEAIEEFALIAELDGPSKLYLERCKTLKENPPESWKGIYEFKNK